jgi:hypothetical protein
MELQITLHSEDEEQAVNKVHLLKNDFEFYLPEAKVKQVEKELQTDEAAVGILAAAVKVLFGKEVIGNVAEIIIAWIRKKLVGSKQNDSKIHLVLKDENGKEFSLTLENIRDIQGTIEVLKSFIPN